MDEIEEMLPLSPATLAILLALSGGDQHGYGVLKAVESQPGAPRLGAGTLYAALQRLMQEGLIGESAAGPAPDEDQRRRYYALTDRGRAVAAAEMLRMARVVASARKASVLPDFPAQLRLALSEEA